MTLTLSFSENPNPDDIQILVNGIKDYAKQQRGFESLDFFACFIRDKDNNIVGGCSGGTLYGGLHIDNLWINEEIRHQGWGTKLMYAALKYGQEKNCSFATVNTMDWEAIEFYKKLGFKLEFERHGFQKNAIFYFLRKSFKDTNEVELLNEEKAVSKNNSPHFKWGQDCDGWWLKNSGHFSVIYETMSAGNAEVKHYHQNTEQFFYCLQGQLTVEFENDIQTLQEQEGITVNAKIVHSVKNHSNNPVSFLVISSPLLPNDRIEI